MPIERHTEAYFRILSRMTESREMAYLITYFSKHLDDVDLSLGHFGWLLSQGNIDVWGYSTERIEEALDWAKNNLRRAQVNFGNDECAWFEPAPDWDKGYSDEPFEPNCLIDASRTIKISNKDLGIIHSETSRPYVGGIEFVTAYFFDGTMGLVYYSHY